MKRQVLLCCRASLGSAMACMMLSHSFDVFIIPAAAEAVKPVNALFAA